MCEFKAPYVFRWIAMRPKDPRADRKTNGQAAALENAMKGAATGRSSAGATGRSRENIPYVHLEGIALKRIWVGEVRTLLVAIGVNGAGRRQTGQSGLDPDFSNISRNAV
jgi:ribosome modulation factor